jgi:hypothetical protein
MSQDPTPRNPNFTTQTIGFEEQIERELAHIAQDPRNKFYLAITAALAQDKELRFYAETTNITKIFLLLTVLQELSEVLSDLHDDLEVNKLTISKYEAELKKAANGIRFLQFRSSYLTDPTQRVQNPIDYTDRAWLINLRDRLRSDIRGLEDSEGTTSRPLNYSPSRQDNLTNQELISEVASLRKQLDEAAKREASRLHKDPKFRGRLCLLLKSVFDNVFQALNALVGGGMTLFQDYLTLRIPAVCAWVIVMAVKTGVDTLCGDVQQKQPKNTDPGVSIPVFNPSELRSNGSVILKIPQSLGIGLKNDVMGFIIPRDTAISKIWTGTFVTSKDNQTRVVITILQGEHTQASKNRKLGEFYLEGLIPRPAGETKIEVAFDIDKNGILAVRAKEQGANTEKILEVTAQNLVVKIPN